MGATTRTMTPRGRPAVVRHPDPDDIPDDELAAACREYDELTERHRAAGRRLHELAPERRRAEEADRRAYGDSLRAGQADPGQVETAKIDAEINEQRRLVAGLDSAMADVEAEIERLRISRHAAMAASLADRDEVLKQALRDVVDELERVRADRTHIARIRAWLNGAPYGGGMPALQLGKPRTSILGPPTSSIDWASVLAGLRAEVE